VVVVAVGVGAGVGVGVVIGSPLVVLALVVVIIVVANPHRCLMPFSLCKKQSQKTSGTNEPAFQTWVFEWIFGQSLTKQIFCLVDQKS